MQWYTPFRHVCVEPYGPYADVLEAAGYECLRVDAVRALGMITADAVYMLDVIEHMEKEEAAHAIRLAKLAAQQQVVIYTPMGFVEQTEDTWGLGGDEWQTHRSGWFPEEFPESEGWATPLYRRPLDGYPEGFYALWEPSHE